TNMVRFVNPHTPPAWESVGIPASPLRHGRCRKRLFHSLDSLGSLGPIRTAALRHVRPPATALAAQRLNASTNEIDRADAAGQVVRHGYGKAGAAFVDGHDCGDARTHALLCLIE